MKRLILLLVLTCLALPLVAQAEVTPQQYPALSLARLTLGARVENTWYTGKQSYLIDDFKYRHEIGVGIVGSYYVVPRLALTGRVLYGTDSKLFISSIGVNFLLFDGLSYALKQGQ